MKTKFYAKRCNCDAIVDYPTIEADIKVVNLDCKKIQAIIDNRVYDIKMGEWTIGGKKFNASFYYVDANLDVYGIIDINRLNEDGTI